MHVRHSKAVQTGLGTTIAVLPVPDVYLDPVRAVLRWTHSLTSALPATTPLEQIPVFSLMRGGAIQPVPLGTAPEAMTDMVRTAVVRAGIADRTAARAYSSHSLRSTYITLSSQAGVSETRLAAVSGHRNLAVLRGYDRTSDEDAAQTEYLSAI